MPGERDDVLSALGLTLPEEKVSDAHEFIISLDGALHQEWGPFANERGCRGQLWQHRDLLHLYRSTKASERDYFVNLRDLKDAAREYIESPWLHNLYLDWVFLDALTAGEIVVAMEKLQIAKLGFVYAICDGVAWKLALWRWVSPLVSLLEWFAPAALAIYFSSLSPWVFWLAGVYYATALVFLITWLGWRIRLLIRRQPTPAQKLMKIVDEAGRAYHSLAGPILHLPSIIKAFENATVNGVTFDHITYYILDHVSKKNPAVWDTNLRDSAPEGAQQSRFVVHP